MKYYRFLYHEIEKDEGNSPVKIQGIENT